MTKKIPSANEIVAVTATPGLSNAIFDSSPDCIKILDLEGHLLAMNRIGQCIMEIDDFQAVCGRQWESFWPEESHGMISAAFDAARAGETGHFDAFCPTPKGTPKWWDVVVAPIRDNDGTIVNLLSVSRDVTPLHEAKEEAQRSHALLKKLTEQAPGALYQFQMHPDGRYSLPYVSSEAECLFELSPAEMMNDASLFFDCVHEDDRAAFIQSVEDSAASLKPWHFEFRVSLPEQGIRWREGRSNPEKLEDGSILWHGYASDITERKQLEKEFQQFHERIAKEANYDSLTDLPNRRLFRDRLEQELKHAARSGHHTALLCLDLDNFKEANDLLGHDAGDDLLKQVSKRIQQCVRPEDTVARLGGDEFTVILAEIDQINYAAQIAQREVVPFGWTRI
jgi:PAS domain S-box-containing protein